MEAVFLFLSVTVMVAVPAFTPFIVTFCPLTAAVAVAVLLDVAVYGVVPPLMFTVSSFPTATFTVDLSTVSPVAAPFTVMLTSAVLRFLSLMVSVVEPALTPVTVTVVFETEAVAMLVFLRKPCTALCRPLQLRLTWPREPFLSCWC